MISKNGLKNNDIEVYEDKCEIKLLESVLKKNLLSFEEKVKKLSNTMINTINYHLARIKILISKHLEDSWEIKKHVIRKKN